MADQSQAAAKRPFDCDPREIRLLLRLRQLEHEPRSPIIHFDLAEYAIIGLLYPQLERFDPPQPAVPISPIGARV